MSEGASRIAQFVLEAYRLKRQVRRGWVRAGVSDDGRYVESVAEHEWGMSLLALTLLSHPSDKPHTLDLTRVFKMIVMHDLAEAIVGDIIPDDNVSKEEKRRLEKDALCRMLEPLKGNPTADEMMSIWEEYEAAASNESKYVKQLDKLDMITQALVYEREGAPLATHNVEMQGGKPPSATAVMKPRLSQFFESTPITLFSDPLLKSVAEQVHQMHRDG